MRRRRLRGRPKACGPDLAAQPVGRLIDARSPARQPPIGGFAKFIGGSRGAPRNPHASCPGLSRGCPVEQKSFVARENLSGIEPFGVLAGLVPAIHAAPLQETFEVGGFRTAWMPRTSPGTTRGGRTALPLYAGRRWREAPDEGRRKLSARPHERAPYATAGQPPRAVENLIRAVLRPRNPIP